MLCFKPQLGVLLPVALVAGDSGGHWRGGGMCNFLVAASMISLGPGAWLGFFDQMVLERRLLQFGSSTWAGMPTVFVLMRMAGADLTAAYLMQAVSAISAAAAIALCGMAKPVRHQIGGVGGRHFSGNPARLLLRHDRSDLRRGVARQRSGQDGFPAMGKNRHFNLIGSPSSFTSARTGRFSNRADPVVADDGRDPSSRPGRATSDPRAVNEISAMYGTADHIGERLEELHAAGAGQVLINASVGALGRASPRRFARAREVIPHCAALQRSALGVARFPRALLLPNW